jgi:predicted acyl esterase
MKPKDRPAVGGMMTSLSTGAYIKSVPGRGDTPASPVLIVHGWKSPIFAAGSIYEEVMESLCALGYHCVMLALRGHAPASGNIETVSRQDHVDDIMAAIHWIEDECPDVDPSRLCAWGTSYGGYLLSTLCSRAHFELLALRAPASYPNKGWGKPQDAHSANELAKWRRRRHTAKDDRALAGLEEFRGDFLLMSSANDELMPPTVREGYQLALSPDVRSRSHVILRDAEHSLKPNVRKRFVAHMIEWFKEHNPEQPPT